MRVEKYISKYFLKDGSIRYAVLFMNIRKTGIVSLLEARKELKDIIGFYKYNGVPLPRGVK